MPLYDLHCSPCDLTIERLVPTVTARDEIVCPLCAGPLTPVLAPSALRFVGTGFYATDYQNKK